MADSARHLNNCSLLANGTELSSIISDFMLWGRPGSSLRGELWCKTMPSSLLVSGLHKRKVHHFEQLDLMGSLLMLLRLKSSLLQKEHRPYKRNLLAFASPGGLVQRWGLGYRSHILTIRELRTHGERQKGKMKESWITADRVVPPLNCSEPPYLHIPD